ncbi:MAG: putative RNA 2'-phosphotransferase [Planctomycetota bacterium]
MRDRNAAQVFDVDADAKEFTMHGSLTERITRSLAYMLRHQPEEFDLELDKQGFGEIGEVVCALNERLGEPIEEDDLMDAIEGGDRPRYEVKDGSIRAMYGHSIQVEAGEGCEPPELLYVGVGSRDANRAEESGLQGGRRTYLHLATSFEEAKETGRRVARNYSVITVYALDAWEEGVQFYDRKSLFLSDPIPTEFLEVGEVFDDGEEPMRRGGRSPRGRGGRGGGRGDRGPRGGNRGGDRGRGFEEDRERNERDDSGRRDERPANRDSQSRDEERRPERPREEPRREERPREAPRREERPREEPKREAPAAAREQAPAPRAEKPVVKSQEPAPGFGLGIFVAPEPEPEPEPEVIVEAAAPEVSAEEAEFEEIVPEQDDAPSEDEAEQEENAVGGFGAGILG